MFYSNLSLRHSTQLVPRVVAENWNHLQPVTVHGSCPRSQFRLQAVFGTWKPRSSASRRAGTGFSSVGAGTRSVAQDRLKAGLRTTDPNGTGLRALLSFHPMWTMLGHLPNP
jgi:hypothetical protein